MLLCFIEFDKSAIEASDIFVGNCKKRDKCLHKALKLYELTLEEVVLPLKIGENDTSYEIFIPKTSPTPSHLFGFLPESKKASILDHIRVFIRKKGAHLESNPFNASIEEQSVEKHQVTLDDILSKLTHIEDKIVKNQTENNTVEGSPCKSKTVNEPLSSNSNLRQNKRARSPSLASPDKMISPSPRNRLSDGYLADVSVREEVDHDENDLDEERVQIYRNVNKTIDGILLSLQEEAVSLTPNKNVDKMKKPTPSKTPTQAVAVSNGMVADKGNIKKSKSTPKVKLPVLPKPKNVSGPVSPVLTPKTPKKTETPVLNEHSTSSMYDKFLALSRSGEKRTPASPVKAKEIPSKKKKQNVSVHYS